VHDYREREGKGGGRGGGREGGGRQELEGEGGPQRIDKKRKTTGCQYLRTRYQDESVVYVTESLSTSCLIELAERGIGESQSPKTLRQSKSHCQINKLAAFYEIFRQYAKNPFVVSTNLTQYHDFQMILALQGGSLRG
jgi:hypothetical protein